MEFTKDELVKELINKAGNLDGLKKFSEKSGVFAFYEDVFDCGGTVVGRSSP